MNVKVSGVHGVREISGGKYVHYFCDICVFGRVLFGDISILFVGRFGAELENPLFGIEGTVNVYIYWETFHFRNGPSGWLE